ncbi:hypothetical protein CFP56_041275 [Quercus suber]|uniref:Uncharacterized protein n=1 Tax=Quercus suber TaxID=58331 RepID=A0AAW0LLD6_QUESU
MNSTLQSNHSVADMVLSIGGKTLVCHDHLVVPETIVWLGGNPIMSPTSLLLVQLSLISLASILINTCLRPLGQTSVVSQIFE